MPNLVHALRDEIQRLARKEVKAQLEHTRKQVAEHRKSIADLKRKNKQIQKRVDFLETREKKRLGTAATTVPNGARFSARSLRSQRTKTGLSQANYAKLLGVSTLTVNNWELQKTRPRPQQFAKIVSLRGLGKRDAEKRLELLDT